MKSTVRRLDDELLHGRFRRWFLRYTVLGSAWGDFLDELDGLAPGALVIDVGAGEATLRGRLAHTRYIAVDRGVGHAGWDYSALDVVADVSAIPLQPAVADFVICKQVLEHVPEPVLALTEIRKLLKPGGRLILSTNQAWPQHQKPFDFFRFTSFGLRYCFETAGLQIVRMDAMGGAFSSALFHFSQTLAPDLWAKTPSGRKIATLVLRPFGWIMKVLMPLVTLLGRLDPKKDNTLGWFVLAERPA